MGRARDQRPRFPGGGAERRPRPLDRGDGERIGQVPPPGVAACGQEEGGGGGDARIGECRAQLFHRRDRIARDLFGRHALVHDLVDERIVGAVLQQAADEIGEKVVMGAHRRIDAAADAVARAHRLVQGLAHSVQPLELEARRVVRHVQHRGHGVRVMRGELGVEAVRHRQQPARAGEIGDVGARLAGEDGEAVEPQYLGALDLAVPVGALDQTHHDAAPVPPGERADPVDEVRGPLAVGLHDDAEAVPAAERGIAGYRLHDVEGEVEPVGLLRVHVEADAGGAGEQCQRPHPRDELDHHAVALAELVAGVQRGQLDRDARPVADALPRSHRGERGDRVRVGEVIAPRVRLRAGRLAQHVVGVAVALRLQLGRAGHGLAHVAAEHEVVPELPHRLGNRRADDGLAEAPDRTLQRAGQALVRLAQHLSGQQQRPGGRVDQRRARLAEMGRPVRRADLVLDQRIDGLGVGHAQQRLGQAHERHALAAREPVLREEAPA